MAAMASSKSSGLDRLFLNAETNSAGIYGYDFCIRGKKWTVDIDDNMLFKDQNNPDLVFANTDKNRTVVWAPLLEKAMAKIKGSYDLSEGGFL